MRIIENVALCKNNWAKGNTQNWFDGEVLKTLRSRNKLFKVFKKTRLYINKELCKKAKYDVQTLIAAKKQVVFDENVSESVSKPKELLYTLKSLGMPNETVVSKFNAIDNNKLLTFDIKTMSHFFNIFLKFRRISLR